MSQLSQHAQLEGWNRKGKAMGKRKGKGVQTQGEEKKAAAIASHSLRQQKPDLESGTGHNTLQKETGVLAGQGMYCSEEQEICHSHLSHN